MLRILSIVTRSRHVPSLVVALLESMKPDARWRIHRTKVSPTPSYQPLWRPPAECESSKAFDSSRMLSISRCDRAELLLLPHTESRPMHIASIDAQALLHRIALVPDVHVIGGQPGRPLRRQRIHAADDHTIDVMVVERPGVIAVGRVQSFARRGRLQCRLCRRLEVLHERQLQRDISVRTCPLHMSADEGVEVPVVNLLHLPE